MDEEKFLNMLNRIHSTLAGLHEAIGEINEYLRSARASLEIDRQTIADQMRPQKYLSGQWVRRDGDGFMISPTADEVKEAAGQ